MYVYQQVFQGIEVCRPITRIGDIARNYHCHISLEIVARIEV